MLTLHEAMQFVLSESPNYTATFDYLSDEIWRRGVYRQKDGGKAPASQLRWRASKDKYSSSFEVLAGGRVQLRNAGGIGRVVQPSSIKGPIKSSSRAQSDEYYIINICDEVLGQHAQRQHHFDFLRGDPNNRNPRGDMLALDAYYSQLRLVIEYHERQHTRTSRRSQKKLHVSQKPRKSTCSGVSRREQRAIYDQRRRDVLPSSGITLIELSYIEFPLIEKKRLRRDKPTDVQVVRSRLAKWLE